MKIKNKNIKYVRKEFQNDFILITCENVNNKWNEQKMVLDCTSN